MLAELGSAWPWPVQPPGLLTPSLALGLPLQRRDADGRLYLRGLVAQPDGSSVFEASRVGGWSEEAAAAMGREAGEELLSQAGLPG